MIRDDDLSVRTGCLYCKEGLPSDTMHSALAGISHLRGMWKHLDVPLWQIVSSPHNRRLRSLAVVVASQPRRVEAQQLEQHLCHLYLRTRPSSREWASGLRPASS